MFNHNQRHPLLVADAAQEAVKLLNSINAEPHRRLVEQYNLGVANECARDLHNAALPEGQRATGPVGERSEAYEVERIAGASRQFRFLGAHALGLQRSTVEARPTAQVQPRHHVL